MALPDGVIDEIRSQVAHGYYPPPVVLASVADLCAEDLPEVTLPELEAEVAKAFDSQATLEKTWPKVTDCDRLFSAFDALRKSGLLALENCGVTLQDGHGFVGRAFVQSKRHGPKGFCFFHEQDVMRALKGGDLELAFGEVLGARGNEVTLKPSAAVGKRVRAALAAAGVRVEWEGSADERLVLPGFRWQCRLREGNRPARPERGEVAEVVRWVDEKAEAAGSDAGADVLRESPASLKLSWWNVAGGTLQLTSDRLLFVQRKLFGRPVVHHWRLQELHTVREGSGILPNGLALQFGMAPEVTLVLDDREGWMTAVRDAAARFEP